MNIKNVVLIGGGVLGSQIAYQTAYKGFNVTIWLRSDDSIGRSKPKIERIRKPILNGIFCILTKPRPIIPSPRIEIIRRSRK